MKNVYLVLCCLVISLYCNAQCEEGEIEVTINAITDAWGYESYWQLQPEGIGCGEAPIFEDGNLAQVNCDSGGDQTATGGNGYANFTTYEIDSICLTLGENYTIHFIDDYGDGGTTFEVFQDGIQTGYYQGSGTGNDFTFTAGDLTPAFIPGDRPCESLSIIEDGEPLLIDNTEATASPGEVEPPELTCGAYGSWCPSNNGASNTMWISFIPQTNGAYEISTCNEGNTFDTALGVYSADDCADYSTFSLISGNDDSYIGCSSGSTGFASICYVSCLNIGEEYFIQLDGWGGGDIGVTELTVSSYDDAPELSAIVTNIQCANVKGETGSRIIPQVTGWGVDYEVVWSGPNDYNSEERVITDLNQGEYSCTVTNACGASLTGTYTISTPEPVNPDFTVSNTTCVGANDGSISTVATGGNDPYEFIWTGADDFVASGEELTGLTEGIYSLLIIDDNDCEYSSVVTVDSDNELEFSLGEDQIICTDETLLLEGPTGFLLYEWQDGSDNSTFLIDGSDGLGEFSINLTVSNSIGCEHTDVVTITVDDCVGLDEISKDYFSVYPNPVEETLYLNGLEDILYKYSKENVFLQMMDLRGANVMNVPLSATSRNINLSHLSSGVYMVQLMTAKEASKPVKIIKK